MNPNNRMIRLDRIPTHKLPIPRCLLGLRKPAMLGAQALEELLYRLRQTLVGRDLRDPRGVAARRRHSEQRQNGDARRLVLVRDVGVPPRGGQFCGLALRAVEVIRAEVDVVEFEEAVDVGSDGLASSVCTCQKRNASERGFYMHMQPPKILPNRLLPLWTDVLKVLVAEDDDPPLGNQQGELVLLLVRELRELQAADLGADTGRQFRDDNVGVIRLEEVRLVLVGEEAAVTEVEGFRGSEFGDGVVDGEVAFVFVLNTYICQDICSVCIVMRLFLYVLTPSCVFSSNAACSFVTRLPSSVWVCWTVVVDMLNAFFFFFFNK